MRMKAACETFEHVGLWLDFQESAHSGNLRYLCTFLQAAISYELQLAVRIGVENRDWQHRVLKICWISCASGMHVVSFTKSPAIRCLPLHCGLISSNLNDYHCVCEGHPRSRKGETRLKCFRSKSLRFPKTKRSETGGGRSPHSSRCQNQAAPHSFVFKSRQNDSELFSRLSCIARERDILSDHFDIGSFFVFGVISGRKRFPQIQIRP